MADDLGDDWWDEGGKSDEDANNNDVSKVDSTDIADRADDEGTAEVEEQRTETIVQKKRKLPETEGGGTTAEKKENKKKKRRKRRRITETTLSAVGATIDEFLADIEDFYKDKLSVVEREALSLSEEHFGPINDDLSHTPASFLKDALPKWQRISASHNQKMSPLVLVLSSGANRVLQVNKESAMFKGENCTTAKLFARHMKPDAQAKFLKSKVIHFAIGTPARVALLLAQGAMSLQYTRLVMLDWNWRDVKLKRMTDVPDIRKALMPLLKDHVAPASKAHHLKIGLY